MNHFAIAGTILGVSWGLSHLFVLGPLIIICGACGMWAGNVVGGFVRGEIQPLTGQPVSTAHYYKRKEEPFKYTMEMAIESFAAFSGFYYCIKNFIL